MIMETFKILKVTIPPDVFVIELTLEEFRRLAQKEDFTPICENSQALFYVDYETRMMFVAQKENQK